MAATSETIARPDAAASPETLDVAVIGAGPVGLTLANLLAGFGVRVAIFDRAGGPARFSRAAVVHARTLETLEPIGIVDEMLARGVVVPFFGVRDRDRRLINVDFNGLPTPYPFTLMLPQDQTEAILREALQRRGVLISWEHELTAIEQDPNGATLTLRSGDRDIRVEARYVVGADGAHSAVRTLSDISFDGETYPQSFVLADVDMAWPLSRDEVQLFFSPEGLVVVAPLPGERRHRIVATVDEAPPEPSLADVQALLDARGPRQPRPIVEHVAWSSRFRVHHRLAARHRSGSVFLAGDAAHVHSPAGGQGMNTGIQDAANLAWKLALVLRGRAADALLDSYERERRAVAEGVVAMTHRMTRVATLRSRAQRMVRNVVMSGVGRIGALPRKMAGNLAQLDLIYRDGWRVDPSTRVERLAPSRRGEASDPALAFRLLVPSAFAARAGAEVAHRSSTAVRIVARDDIDQAILVRPDGYVAGRSAPSDVTNLLDGLDRALDPTSAGAISSIERRG
jgi:2-polyprenyl-6-methoxyphenol hydroxylase-like FAD-dependent oxidoreductase